MFQITSEIRVVIKRTAKMYISEFSFCEQTNEQGQRKLIHHKRLELDKDVNKHDLISIPMIERRMRYGINDLAQRIL